MKATLRHYSEGYHGPYIKASAEIAKGNMDSENEIHQKTMEIINNIKQNEKTTLYRAERYIDFADVEIGMKLDKRIYSFSRDNEWLDKVIKGEDEGYDIANYKQLTSLILVEDEYLDITAESVWEQDEVLTYSAYEIIRTEVIEVKATEVKVEDLYIQAKDLMERFEKRTSKKGNELYQDKETGISYQAKEFNNLYIDKETNEVKNERAVKNNITIINELNAKDNYTKNIAYIKRI